MNPKRQANLSKARWQRVCLAVLVVMMLTACQKTTRFNYDPLGDPYAEAAQAMEGLGIDYNPPVERMVVVAIVLKDGVGLLQEHQSYDFSNINLETQPGGKILISVPEDPADAARWSLVRNEVKTSSRPYQPQFMLNRRADKAYDRVNFLLEPDMNSNISFVLEDDEGNRTMTFRVNITGLE